jgi:hypothetical protein
MGPFAALERFFERLFERPSARLFRARLQPVQLLRRVERAMETARRTTADAVLLPEHVVVRLHPGDLAGFEGEVGDLATELADGAMRFARAHGYRLRERPRVDLVADPSMRPGDPAVEARFEGAKRAHGVSDAVGHDAARSAGDPPAHQADDRTMAFGRPNASHALAGLRVLEPHGGDRTIPLSGGVLTIGRDRDNDLVLGDPRVSRRHARIQARQGRLVLSDLDSRNGTRVNGTPIDEVAIGLGDEILVGDTRLIVDAADA